MRATLVALALLFVGCASTLKQHAQAASTSAQIIDGVGAAIEREAAEDYEELLHAPAEERGPKLETLKAQYHKVRVAYDVARAALASYTRAIVAANAAGEKTLKAERVQLLRDAWASLIDAAEQLGIDVPEPPELLARLLGGAK